MQNLLFPSRITPSSPPPPSMGFLLHPSSISVTARSFNACLLLPLPPLPPVSRCHKKSICHLKASNKIFADPCSGVPKYLWVRWSCKPSMFPFLSLSHTHRTAVTWYTNLAFAHSLLFLVCLLPCLSDPPYKEFCVVTCISVSLFHSSVA